MANGDIPANVNIDIGGWLASAWEFFVEDAVPWLIISLIATLIYWLLAMVLGSIPVIGQVALLALGGPLFGGMFYAAFARMRGTPVSVGMLFVPLQTDLVPLLIVGLVGGILQSLGLVLFCVGIFITYPLWMFGIPLVLERKMPFWDALELSRTTVQPQLGQWILFGLVSLLIFAAGILVFGIGVLVTMPISLLMVAVAYRDVFGLQSPGAASVMPTPPPAPPAPEPSTPEDDESAEEPPSN